MASRILGMGDVLPLIEEAKKGIDEEKAVAFAKKLKSGKGFDLNDFQEQIGQMRSMGRPFRLMDKLPAQFAQAAGGCPPAPRTRWWGRIEGIINSMTPRSRPKPELIKASRKRRIATGAGVQVQEVNRLLNQFEQSQKMMKQLTKGRHGQADAGHERPAARDTLIPIRAPQTDALSVSPCRATARLLRLCVRAAFESELSDKMPRCR